MSHKFLLGIFFAIASSFLAIPLFILAYNWMLCDPSSQCPFWGSLWLQFSQHHQLPLCLPLFHLCCSILEPFLCKIYQCKLSLPCTHMEEILRISLNLSISSSFPKLLKTVAVGWNPFLHQLLDMQLWRHYLIFLKLSSFIWKRKVYQILHKLPLHRSSDTIVNKCHHSCHHYHHHPWLSMPLPCF